MHRSDFGLLENDEGGGEGGAAGAATGSDGGEGGGRYTVSLATHSLFLSFFLFLSLLCQSSRVFFSPSARPVPREEKEKETRRGAGAVAASRWRTARGRSGRRTGKECI